MALQLVNLMMKPYSIWIKRPSQDAAMEYLTLGFVHEIMDCFENLNHREFI